MLMEPGYLWYNVWTKDLMRIKQTIVISVLTIKKQIYNTHIITYKSINTYLHKIQNILTDILITEQKDCNSQFKKIKFYPSCAQGSFTSKSSLKKFAFM